MAENQMRIDFLVGKDDISRKLSEIERLTKKLDISTPFNKWKIVYNTQDAATQKIIETGKQIELNKRRMDQFTESTRRFDMRWLSVMFTGMMVDRALSGALRSISNTYERATENQTALGQATMGLTASWEFLKFSIFNALDQPGIRWMIDGLINIVNWVSEGVNKFPLLTASVLGLVGLFAIGGKFATAIGGLAMFWVSMFGPYGFFPLKAAAGMGTAAAEAGTVTGAWSTAFLWMKDLVAGGLLIYAAYKVVKAIGSEEEVTGQDALWAALSAGVGTGLILGGPAGIFATLTVGVAMAMIEGAKETTKQMKEIQDLPPERRGIYAPEGTTTIPGSVSFKKTPFPELTTMEAMSPALALYNKGEQMWDWLTGKSQLITTYVDDMDRLTPSLEQHNKLMDYAMKNVFPKQIGDDTSGVTGLSMAYGKEETGLGPRISTTNNIMDSSTKTYIPSLINKQNEWKISTDDVNESLRVQIDLMKEINELRSAAYSSYNVSSAW
jgi:hypothetical protein